MNKLNEIIKKLCPDGAEYRKLGEVAHYAKERIDAREVDVNSYVGVENLLQNKQGKTFANSVPMSGKVIRFDIGDILIGNIRPYLKKIWLSDCVGGTNGDVLVIQIDDRTEIVPEFLYYILSSDRFFLYDMQNSKGAKMPRGSKEAVMKYKFPVPPLEVQCEIVRILDSFTLLTAELTAELTARKKQYEFYRDKLLTTNENLKTVRLGDVCTFVRGPFGGALKKEIFCSEGYVVYEQQHAIYRNLDFRYYIDKNKFLELKRFAVRPGDMIVSCSGTIGRTFVIPEDAPEGVINQALLKLTPNAELNVFYLQYFFEN